MKAQEIPIEYQHLPSAATDEANYASMSACMPTPKT